jgi:hypothetical protein
MAITLIYKNHFIFADGLFDRSTGHWVPIIDVSWKTPSGSTSHILNERSRSYKTKKDAEKSGAERAKAWVDEGRQLSVLDLPDSMASTLGECVAS